MTPHSGLARPLAAQSNHLAYASPTAGWFASAAIPHRATLPLQAATRNRAKGALWGGGIGLVAGGLLGGLTVGSDDDDDGFGGELVESAATGEAVVLGAIVGVAMGAILGATVFAPARGGADASDAPFAIQIDTGIHLLLRWRR